MADRPTPEPALEILRAAAQRARIARRLQGDPETALLQSIVDATVTLFDAEAASGAIARGEADLVAFGIPYLANPDLPERLRRHAPLNAPDRSTFYGGSEHGYTDYPALTAQL